MKSSLRYGRTLTVTLLVSGSALLAAPVSLADPQTEQPGPVNVAAPAPLPPDAPAPDAVPADQGTYAAVVTACKQFGVALDYAAKNYEDFAYNTAGGGNNVNYDDPNVANSNVRGRTALREAASTGMDAANTPGLPGDISAPMRSWSMRAAKLLLLMGIRGGGDSLNSTAGDMNTDAKNAQMACAVNGGRA
jgi:hypothetical protein